MPITIPDDIKRISAEAAEVLFYSRLLEINPIAADARQIAKWMADSYREGWSAGVNQSMNLINQIR